LLLAGAVQEAHKQLVAGVAVAQADIPQAGLG
jgi:hypothetical protein